MSPPNVSVFPLRHFFYERETMEPSEQEKPEDEKSPVKHPEESRAGTIGVPYWFRPFVFPAIALVIIAFVTVCWIYWLYIR